MARVAASCRFPPILPSSLCPHRAPARTTLPLAARPPVSRDTGRAAAGRAGSFCSGKNAPAWRQEILQLQLTTQVGCGGWPA